MVTYRELASAKVTAGQTELVVLNRKCNDARRRMMYHLDAAMTAYMGGGQAHKKMLFYVDKAMEELLDKEVQRALPKYTKQK